MKDALITPHGLPESVLRSMSEVFAAYPEVSRVFLFGSRAKGTHRPESDVDLALEGDCPRSRVARIAFELDELPVPYSFDVQALAAIDLLPLREHIERVGVPIYDRR